MSDIELEKLDAILKGINSAIKGKKLYPAGHPATTTPMTKAYQVISEILRTNNKIFIGMAKDVLVFEETPFMEAEKNLGEFFHQIKAREIEGIIFEKGVMQNEFFSFIDILSGDNLLKGKELQNTLSAKNILHISVKSIVKRSILDSYNDTVNVVKDTMSQIRMGKIPQSKEIVKANDEMTELILTNKSAMLGLTMIKNYDDYLFTHSVNVNILSISLAQHMNYNKSDLHIVGIAALLHDVGKTGVSEDIIKKPAGLSGEEWERVKQHPLLGSKIIEKMDDIAKLVGRIIYEHHIRYDHSGYPNMESPLHPMTLIVNIADAYDALTTLRVYQKPHHPVDAIKIMNSLAGKHFAPDTLKAFISMVGFYPIGTAVRLSNNDIGIVTRINTSNSLCPTVKIVSGENGNRIDKPYELDLSAGASVPAIVAPIDPLTAGLNIDNLFEEASKNIPAQE